MTDVLDRPTLFDEHRLRRAPSTDHSSQPMADRVSSLVMLLPIRIFLAAGWLRAGAEKLIDGQWWSGEHLQAFVSEQHDAAIPFFRPVMDHVIAPAAPWVAFVVMITQLMCGLAIGAGRRMRLALRWAFLLNVVFILAGRVNPSAFYLIMEAVLLFAIADGTIGHRHSTPTNRTFITAGMSALFALAFVPYIRTIQPAEVIDDPAMMLSFLGAVVATTLVVRLAAHPERRDTRLGQLWAQRLHGWSAAAPRDRNETPVRAN
jgi:uncharacterized membrane protein YphA (DoxX/SURF4 family)